VTRKFVGTSARRDILKFGGLALLGAATANPGSARTRQNDMLVYVGTYTSGKSDGIYLYRLKLTSGELEPVATTKGVVNPSFVALSPSRRYLYAVNEIEDFKGSKNGAISSFAVDQRTGALRFLNQQSSLGGSPCYLEVDASGRFVLVANYTGGNVSVLPVQRDGSLDPATDVKQFQGSSVNLKRQEASHAHCIMLDAANRFAYSCDLGADKIMIFRFDAQRGALSPAPQPWVKTKPGAGPRHLAFHPAEKYVFVLNELNATVTVFARNGINGGLEEVQSLPTLPSGFTAPNTTAEVRVSPDGRFLYCSNRGHDSIAIFSIDTSTGNLTSIGHESTRGKGPRDFGIVPGGDFLLAANQKSDSIVVFKRDQKTGQLSATGKVVDVPSPVCLKFAPAFS
jgi:6-phosphogluconolactonase